MKQRRTFILKSLTIASGFVVSLLTLFGLFPELIDSKRKRTKVNLGNISDIFGEEYSIVKQVEGSTLIMIRKKTGGIQAFSAECTHAGCTVEWQQDNEQFLCKCHGGMFNNLGNPIAGPPKLPLQQFPISIREISSEVIVHLETKSNK